MFGQSNDAQAFRYDMFINLGKERHRLRRESVTLPRRAM
jgi:hypothetical protein